MSEFEDHLAADVAIFTNLEEFGEMLEFDGVPEVEATLESIEYEPAKHGFDGYNIERKRLFVALGAITRPVPNQQVTLNGEYWIVDHPRVEDGMMIIDLSRNVS